MSTPTPGPWERQWSWNGFDIVADGPPIARVHFGHDMDGAIANSHLISAAPDLLAVLKEYLAWGAMTGSDRDLFDSKFREAIAKAEGKGQAA